MPGRVAGRLSGLLAVVAALVVATAASAEGAIRYAAPDGDGSSPCPLADPCPLDGAIAAAGGGDEVSALPGTYATSGLTVAGGVVLGGPGSGAPAAIAGDDSGPALSVHGDGTLVRGLTVTGGGFDAVVAVGAGAVADRLSVTAVGAGAACSVAVGGLIRDSLCHAGTGNGVLIDEEDPVTGTARVINVTAVSEGDEGVGAAFLVRVWSGVDLTVEATNTIGASLGAAPDVAVGALEGSSAHLALSHSNFATVALLGSGATATAPDAAGNQAAEPIFTDPAAGRFTEDPGSPTVDAGIAGVAGHGILDLAGNARTVGPAPDIGAYELQPRRLPPVRIGGPEGRVVTAKRFVTLRFHLRTRAAGASFRCRLDGGPAAPCSSPAGFRLRATRAGSRHVLAVRAVDGHGNRSAPATQRFRLVRVAS